MVRGVLVCVCACAWVAVAAEVSQEVDRIFKTVESLMAGDAGTEQRRTEKSQPAVASDRAFPGPVSFPVGVILSDKLYPLVVGRNLETGAPFVMNLDKQHALVVARGGAQDYRMVIPFPVVVGSPHASHLPQHDPSESLYGSGRSVGQQGYPMKTPYYPSYGREPPKKFLVDSHSRGKYYDEQTHAEHGPSLNYQDAYGPSKDTEKYASDYQSYRNYHSDDGVKYDDSRYKPPPPKKYAQRSPYINYFGVDHKPVPVTGGKYVPFSINHPLSKYRSKNYTRYQSSDEPLSYYVAGPKYTLIPPATHRYKIFQPQSYRAISPSASRPTKQYPPPRQVHGAAESPNGDHVSDFKPSPYLGSIPEDGPSTPAAPLEPHSEEFESYDDREPDYIETSSRSRPGSSGVGVESSGGVRHVTHHADDYLGKIYEDMYYKVAPNTYSDGPPSYEALESRHSNSTESASASAPSRTGPVTFDPPPHHTQHHDREDNHERRRSTATD